MHVTVSWKELEISPEHRGVYLKTVSTEMQKCGIKPDIHADPHTVSFNVPFLHMPRAMKIMVGHAATYWG